MKLLSKDLYSLKQIDETRWEVTLSDASHPVFKSHFEGNPLLPAFLQIDIMGEILNKRLVRIERCKFKQPILPNDVVMYEILKQVDNAYKIKITKDNIVTSEIKVVYA